MTRRSWLRRADWQPPILRRLERAAYVMNPFLIVIVIGLIIVIVSCYTALEIGRLHSRSSGVGQLLEPGPRSVRPWWPGDRKSRPETVWRGATEA